MPFVKGDPKINRNGRPTGVKSEKTKLLEALETEGKNRSQDFYEKVAKAAYDDKGVMVAVLKKIVPDMSHNEIEGSLEVNELPTVKIGGIPLELRLGDNLN